MLILSPKVRVALTVVATVLAALVPVLADAPTLAVIASAVIALLAAAGIVPSHLEVSADE